MTEATEKSGEKQRKPKPKNPVQGERRPKKKPPKKPLTESKQP